MARVGGGQQGMGDQTKKGQLTYLYTHLDMVLIHVKIYAHHIPASCQVPQEPVVVLVGMGEQRGPY